MSYLNDGWMASGKDIESFEKTLQKIEETTVVFPMAMRTLRFCAVAENVSPVDGKIPIHVYNKDNVLLMPAKSAINVEAMIDAGVPVDILDEFKLSQLLIQYNSTVFFTARYLSRDLGARAGLGGESFDQPCEARARYLMDRFAKTDGIVNAIVRKDNNVAKIIAMGSRTFSYVPQKILLELLSGFESELGKAECVEWSVSHRLTRLVVAFPQKQEDLRKIYGIKSMPMPGMLLETSDTGDSSIRCSAVWITSSRCAFATAESYSRRHSFSTERKDKKTLAEVAVEEAENAVFKTYTKLPERLAALFAVDVIDPLYCIDQIAEGLKLQKHLGLHRGEALVETLKASIHPAEKYTGYDIAMLFLGMSECEFGEDGVSSLDTSVTRSRLEALAYQAVFLPIEKWAKSGGKIAVIA